MAITALVLAVLVDSAASFLFLFQCGIISLALPAFIAAGKSAAKSIAYTIAINAGLILLLAGIYGMTQGVDLHVQVLKGIQSSIAQTAAVYEKAGVKGDELKVLQQGMAQAGVLIGRIYPSLVVVTLAVIAGLNLMLLRKVSARLPEPPALGEFTRFKNPDQLVWILIVAGFSMLIDNRLATTTALNILVVTVSLYFMQGLAITAISSLRFSVPRLARILFYLVLLLQPYLTVIVAALGIFDIWGDFRSPKQQQNL